MGNVNEMSSNDKELLSKVPRTNSRSYLKKGMKQRLLDGIVNGFYDDCLNLSNE